jgi:hypothetical protein
MSEYKGLLFLLRGQKQSKKKTNVSIIEALKRE